MLTTTTTHKLTADEADRIKHALLSCAQRFAGDMTSPTTIAQGLIDGFALVDAATAPPDSPSSLRATKALAQP